MIAQRTKDLTAKFFKSLGIEVAKNVCYHIDEIIDYFSNRRSDNNI